MMSESPNIVRITALIADNARAEVLCALMSGRALTATELANMAGVTKQTMSFHLGRLLDEALVTVEQQGRHRYFRLAGPQVAELLETLMGLAVSGEGVNLVTGPRDPALRKARVCYDHLAGELGVWVYEQMLQAGIFQLHSGGLQLTEYGRVWFQQLGIDTDEVASSKRSFCRGCLDWSERKDHLAGALGAAFLNRIEALGWAKRAENSRAIVFSAKGEKAIWAMFATPSALPTRTQQPAATGAAIRYIASGNV
jgi:DNA-binding transcriptional ArsR family regulator